MPLAIGAVGVAIISAAPEFITAVRAALDNRMQTVVNIALGASLATILLTIPAVIVVTRVIDMDIILELTPIQGVMLGLTFLGRTPLWSKNDFRDFLIENIIYQKKYETAIELRFLYYLKARFFGRFTQNTWFNNYQFRNGNNYLSKIDIPEFGIKLRYAYNEHFIKTPYGIQALPNKYPILYFNITKSLIFDSYNTDYTKISGKFLAKKTIRNWGTSYFNIETGYTWGTIPYFLLFNGQGSYTSFNRGGGINIFNSFGTMKLNEFVNQQFVYLFYKHQFGLLLFRSKYFNPKPGIIQNIGWGELNNKDLHTGIPIKDMHKGFFETGLLIDNIYSDSYSEYGIAIYYRYGAYSYTKWQDNLFFKLSFVYKFMAE